MTLNSEHYHVFIVLKSLTKKDRSMKESDKNDLREFIDMLISSQALPEILAEKVQRLEGDTSYTAIAIGSGSSRVPINKVGM